MKAKLICYTLKNADHATRSSFKREFIGYQDKSNKGKYNYKRKGLIDNIPNIRPARGVIIVKEYDEPKIKKVLKRYKAKINSLSININSKEFN